MPHDCTLSLSIAHYKYVLINKIRGLGYSLIVLQDQHLSQHLSYLKIFSYCEFSALKAARLAKTRSLGT